MAQQPKRPTRSVAVRQQAGPAGPLRYRCAVFIFLFLFCKRDPALLSNRATLGATITQEMNFALSTSYFTIFTKGRSTPALRTPARLRPAHGCCAGHQGPALAQLQGRSPSTTQPMTIGSGGSWGGALGSSTAAGNGLR